MDNFMKKVFIQGGSRPESSIANSGSQSTSLSRLGSDCASVPANRQGTITSTVRGVLFMAIYANGLVLLDISGYWERAIIGSVVLIAIWVDLLRPRKLREVESDPHSDHGVSNTTRCGWLTDVKYSTGRS
jgi:hypothetical protein